ncbi:MAG TPA: AMP-binding protein, partial [Candidatus Binataceae bacterium]|nr:AMP-binding protein [Candidatus Binataceae bacterium]
MAWKTIEKPREWAIAPNLPDYEATRAAFSWAQARRALDGIPGGRGLNIAYEAVDRHAAGTRGSHLALRWLGRRGETRDFTYAELCAQTNRFANVLKRLGVERGERIYLLAGRIPELYISGLGALKGGHVFCPLFSAFGPEPIRQRISLGDGRVLVTTAALFKRKVAEIRASLPGLRHVILIGEPEEVKAVPDAADFRQLMAQADDRFEIAPTQPEDLALLHFTSGTTGTPKGAMHVHEAVVAHHMTGRFALDFHPGDVFWCTADPGWVTGTSYGIIAPLTHGITSIVDEADFDAERWYGIVQEQKVTVWYTAPTAVRMMMKVGCEVIRKYDLKSLRLVASVGEPLNPEAVVWGQEAFGLPIHDNWWQTETGGIMIANYLAMDIRPGSMGRPLPGITAGIVQRTEGGVVREITSPMVMGELALRPGWPSMMRAYLN